MLIPTQLQAATATHHNIHPTQTRGPKATSTLQHHITTETLRIYWLCFVSFRFVLVGWFGQQYTYRMEGLLRGPFLLADFLPLQGCLRQFKLGIGTAISISVISVVNVVSNVSISKGLFCGVFFHVPLLIGLILLPVERAYQSFCNRLPFHAHAQF